MFVRYGAKNKTKSFFHQDVSKMKREANMGAPNNIDAVTIFAKLRERYNEEHSHYLSQEALARKFGVSKSTISRLETDPTRRPKSELLQKYSDFFGVSLDDLTGTKPDNRREQQATALRAMGLSDSTVKTLQHIADTSTSSLNLMALVNALLGSGEHTIAFLLEIMDCLKSDNSNAFAELFTSKKVEYFFDKVVKPQMEIALGKARKMDDLMKNIPDEIKYADTPDK